MKRTTTKELCCLLAASSFGVAIAIAADKPHRRTQESRAAVIAPQTPVA
jgi:hypothetical protein